MHKCFYACRPTKNVTVVAWNLVSNVSQVLDLEVFYKINRIKFYVDDELGDTTSQMSFYFRLKSNVKVPMHICNISINFNYGSNQTYSVHIDETAGTGTKYAYHHLFDMQGNFTVEAKMENVLGPELFSLTVRIWDSLLPLNFVFNNSIKEKYIITNTVGQFHFIDTPNFGFQYTIDFGDGSAIVQNANSDILYSPYGLTIFEHTYTSEGVYIVTWRAWNGESSYDREEHFPVHVQNRVPPTGYEVQPFQKKYPWVNLQYHKIPVNITLDNSVLVPTNATCTFNADDGTPSVDGLAYNSRFLEHRHSYLQEGYFYTSFNCSNDVSNHTYEFEVEVRKCQASDISLVFHNYVPLNVTDSVTVYFHIDNNGFALIPYNISLSFEYGDGQTDTSLTYDVTTFDHHYTERGNYSITLTVDANISNTTQTVFYSLRLGLMYFEYNTTVQYINTTLQNYHMYGIRGNAYYTIDFDDDTMAETCHGFNRAPCDIPHYCPQWGYHFVEVEGSNGSFIERDHVNITCDNPIKNLTVGDAATVAIPTGVVDAKLILNPGDLFLPRLTCYWNMGDPLQLGTDGPMHQRVTHWNPFNYTFKYIALGRLQITIDCENLISSIHIETKITVTNKDFLFLGVFDRFYSRSYSPLPISSMLDIEIFSRLVIEANYLEKTHKNLWELDSDVLEASPNRHHLEFSRGIMSPRTHKVILTICIVEEPGNCIFEPTYVRFVIPPPHAEIDGGKRRYVNRGLIRVDAYSRSYDPAHPYDSNLNFTFECFR